MAADRARTRRFVDIVGGIGAIVGVVGLVLQPSLAFLWAFLILFGITTVPERLVRAIRDRRR